MWELAFLCFAICTVPALAIARTFYKDAQITNKKNEELALQIKYLSRDYSVLAEELDKANDKHKSIQIKTESLLADREVIISKYAETINEMQVNQAKEIKKARADSVVRSKRVNKGFVLENLAPHLQTHWDPQDLRHMGDPIDYLVINGYTAVKNKEQKEISEVILLDIKSGNSNLSTIQRRIRDAVAAGNVKFAMLNPETNEMRTWPPEKPDPQEQLPFGKKNEKQRRSNKTQRKQVALGPASSK